MPRGVQHTDTAGARPLASGTAFDALTVDYLPSDPEDDAPQEPHHETPSRKSKKNAAKPKAEAARGESSEAAGAATEDTAQQGPAPRAEPNTETTQTENVATGAIAEELSLIHI